MRYGLAIMLLIFTLQGWAQTAPGQDPLQRQQNAPMDPEQEMRALSGQLKDLHGQVHQRRGALDKHLAGATDNSRIRLTQLRDELDVTMNELENSLNEVNSNDPENWPEIKARAEDVKERAEATLEKVRTTSMSAVN